MGQKRRVIGFAGRKGAGKTMMANMLAEKIGAEKLSIATALKVLCTKLLGGITLEELNIEKDRNTKVNLIPTTQWYELISKETDIPFGDIKKAMDGQFFVTIRQLLQFLGTDVIRAYNPDWHIIQTMKTIEDNPAVSYVLDDIRYPNERDSIESELHGDVYFIVRPHNFNVSNHISERSLGWRNFESDRIIINGRRIDDLNETIECIADKNETDDLMHLLVLRSIWNDHKNWRYFFEECFNNRISIEEQIKNCDKPLVLEDLKLFLDIDETELCS